MSWSKQHKRDARDWPFPSLLDLLWDRAQFLFHRRCQGLLKPLANVRILRHHIMNSASFLPVDLRQGFPSPNVWFSQNISQASHSFCTQPMLHQHPPPPAGRGTCRPPDLRPALEDMSPLQSLSRSVSLSGDNFVPSSGERKTRFSILQNLKNRLMKMLEVLKERTGVVLAHKEGLPLSAAGSTIQNQWLMNPGLQEPAFPLAPALT